ncbi:MAG: hypothetical protein J1G01_06820 [Clostridiales bacterium]|nr:hypothetical protein [Clostridiales bacterium]
MSQEQQEKIEYQYIMNYKAYRRKMIATRSAVTAVIVGCMLALCVKSVVAGIILAITATIIGVISVLVSLGNEQTYTVYNTRTVIKKRGDDKRVSLPHESIVKVAYKGAFYEKGLATGTITLTAANENGKLKKYKLKHLFGAQPLVDYYADQISKRKGADNEDRK